MKTHPSNHSAQTEINARTVENDSVPVSRSFHASPNENVPMANNPVHLLRAKSLSLKTAVISGMLREIYLAGDQKLVLYAAKSYARST